jgi:hypothetical protein
MTETEIKNKIEKLQEIRNILNKEYKSAQNKLVKNYNSLSKLRNELDLLYAKEGKLDDIKYLIDNYKTDNSKTYSDALGKWMSKYTFRNMGTYNTKTKQPCFTVSINRKGSNIERTYEGLKILVPLLKSIEDDEVQFGILEDTLGEYKSYYLNILKNFSKAEVVDHYSFPNPYFSGGVKDCLGYISKHLWYDHE